MRDYHINIFYSEEDGGYIADIPDLEACSAFGETPEEALKEVQKAKSFGCRLPVLKASSTLHQSIARSSTKRHPSERTPWKNGSLAEHVAPEDGLL
jgi:hypothetical protein